MLRLFLILIFLLQIGCGAGFTGFITGVAGNITSDTFDRLTSKEYTGKCKDDQERNDPEHRGQLVFTRHAPY
jgi:hypothetical protein